ncbi:MAG: hypothetical protein ACK5XV_05205 [Flavobacteriales bacterium]|jgi:hypothetical protein
MKGIPAFPFTELNQTGGVHAQYFGMTLRDYFAAMAMQGMLAASENYQTHELAQYAYDVADAMLDFSTREKK